MDIRNGKYLDDNRQPIPEFFYEMVDEYEKDWIMRKRIQVYRIIQTIRRLMNL